MTFAFRPDAGPVQRRKVVRSVLLPAGGPLTPRDLWLDVDRDGAYLDVDLERTPGALDDVRADIATAALAGGESDPIVRHFQSMVTAEQVRSLAGNAWALGSGFYAGSFTLTPGTAYEIDSAEPVPMLGPSPVESTTLLEMLGRVPCHAAADDLGCLEVITFTEIDPEAMAARLHAYLQQVAARSGTARAAPPPAAPFGLVSYASPVGEVALTAADLQ